MRLRVHGVTMDCGYGTVGMPEADRLEPGIHRAFRLVAHGEIGGHAHAFPPKLAVRPDGAAIRGDSFNLRLADADMGDVARSPQAFPDCGGHFLDGLLLKPGIA